MSKKKRLNKINRERKKTKLTISQHGRQSEHKDCSVVGMETEHGDFGLEVNSFVKERKKEKKHSILLKQCLCLRKHHIIVGFFFNIYHLFIFPSHTDDSSCSVICGVVVAK